MLQDVENIGRIIRNAKLFNPRFWETRAMQQDDTLQIVQQLFALLDDRNVTYLLVGGIALLNYVEGRNTEDIDLIMALAELDNLPEIKVDSQDAYFARGTFHGLQIDFLLTENPLFRTVQESYATRLAFLEREIPIATVHGLLLLKLYALPSLYRQGDFARVSIYENDIAALLYAYKTDTGKLMAELAQYVSASDLTSLREIVADIGQRIRRFRETQDGPSYSTDE